MRGVGFEPTNQLMEQLLRLSRLTTSLSPHETLSYEPYNYTAILKVIISCRIKLFHNHK